jgi:Carboxypeptidase regulatory-like domain/TonB dependent receptor
MSLRRSHCLLPVLVLFIASFACAQTSLSGAIAGSAFDAQQAAVTPAKITLRSADTGETLEALTSPTGAFRILGLKPGYYSLTAASQGFADFRLLRVNVEVGRVTEVRIDFAVAAASQSVEVRDQAPAVNISQPDFATNLDDAAIDNLPINGRRWSNFALLTPGATLDGDFGLISFRGISGLMNNSTVDGADNNQAFFSEERGRTRISYVISQAAVQEFQVNTSNFSAQYGRAAGAVVNAVTRSGGNQLHGTAFYYMRDNQLGATNAFTVVPVEQNGQWSTEKIKPLDRRQQFGGTLGGPIVHDKLFYFATFDGQRRDYPAVAAAGKTSRLFAPPCVIPSHYAGMSSANRAQVQVCGTDNSIDEIYTLTRNVMPLYTPDSTAIAAFQGGIGYLASLLGPVPRTANHQSAMAKLDYHLNSRNTLSLSFNRLRFNSPGGVQTQPVVARGIASFGFDGVKVDTLIARLTSTFGHSMANELRYSWSRDFNYQVPQPPAPGEPVGPNGLAPSVNLLASSSGFTFGTPTTMPRRSLPDEYRHQIADTVSWIRGTHSFKFGFDASRVQEEMNNLYAVAGSYNYYRRDNFIADLCQWQQSPIAQFCPGQPLPTQYRGYSSYIQGFGTPSFAFRTFDGAVFAQDDWRALRRLTLSFGLRYEFELLPSPQTPNPLLAGSQSFPSDLNNFGPRVGFALSLTNDAKTSLRGGYGLYYARIGNSTISSAITNTGTQLTQRSYAYKACYLFAANCLEGPLFPNVNPASADPYSTVQGGSVAVFSPHMQVPQIHQADLIVERQIAPNTVISASYLLSLGRELPNFTDINLDPASLQPVTYTFAPDHYAPGPYNGHTLTVPVYTARLNPNFQTITQIRSNINSSYSALVLQFNRTSTKGLGFKLNYTWSHALDDGQNSTTFTPTHSNNLSPIPYTYQFDGVSHLVSRPDYGTSNYDVRQRLVASIHWSPRLFAHSHGILHDALDHWSLAPIVQIASGRPYSDNIGGDAPITTCSGCTGFMGTGGQTRLPFLGRNSYRYGNLYNTDLRLSRRIYFGEEHHELEFLAEAFNLLNHQNVTHRASTLYTTYNSPAGPTLEYDSNFGTPTAAANTIYREREIQLGMRLHF